MPNVLIFADDAARIALRTYRRGNAVGLDEDFDQYGPGKSFAQSDRRMRREPFANNWSALRSQQYTFLGGVPQISFSSARAQRGEVLSTFADYSVGIASYPLLTGLLNPISKFLLPTTFGIAGAAAMTAILAVLPAYGLGKAAKAAVRYFSQFGYRQRHIEMGGDYQDTATAYNLRIRAISEMSSAMSYSRRWLGNEALFMRS